MVMIISRFNVFLVSLDPTQGSEIKKTRPCVVISPDEVNHFIKTVIVAPMTTKTRDYPTRLPLLFNRKEGHIVLDQIRTVDKSRLLKHIGKLSESQARQLINSLQEMFAW